MKKKLVDTKLVVVESEELQKAIAVEILYSEKEECPEELFEKGEKIDRIRNPRNDNQGGEQTG